MAGVSRSTAGGSGRAVQPHEPAEVGWLRAHVRIGDSYPLVAVRVTRRATHSAGPVAALDSEHEAVLGTAAYAVDVARALYQAGGTVSSLELEASMSVGDARAPLDLRV